MSPDTSKRKIRVLHCITSLDPDGAQRMLLKVCQHVSSSRFEFRIINLREHSPFSDRFSELGIPVEHLSMSPNRPSIRALKRMRDIINEFQPDVIQGWMYHSNLLTHAARMLSSNKPPIIWNIRTSVPHVGKSRLVQAITQRLGARLSFRAHKVIFQGSEIAANYAALGYSSENQVIIPNGFDTDFFRPSTEVRTCVRESLGLAEDTPIVGLVGRYHPTKDHANFLRAAALVSVQLPEARFVLAGRGIDQSNIEIAALAKDLGISSKLHLLGECPAVEKLLPAFDVYAQSSVREGFPNSLGEAMACEVPCVSTAAGGSAEVVDGAGTVVPISDSAALGAAVIEILKADPSERRKQGALGRERVMRRYSLPVVAAGYEDLYSAAVEAQGTEQAVSEKNLLVANGNYYSSKDSAV